MSCDEYRLMLVSYLEESLEESSRAEFRRHLRDCGRCREWAVTEEPSLIFSAIDTRPADQKRVEACADAVCASIRQSRLKRRLFARRRPWLAVAAAMIVVISGGLSWRYFVDTGSGLSPQAIQANEDVDHKTSAPRIEVNMGGEDVRVYHFASEDGSDAAVYIVNPSMDL